MLRAQSPLLPPARTLRHKPTATLNPLNFPTTRARPHQLARLVTPTLRRAPSATRPLTTGPPSHNTNTKNHHSSVYGTVAGNANYAILGGLIDKAGLAETLTKGGPFTCVSFFLFRGVAHHSTSLCILLSHLSLPPPQQPKQNNPPEKQNSAFAPNDDAFAAAAKALGTTKLGLRELPNLADILKYHVVAGTVLSGDLKDGQEVETIGGKKFKVTIAGGVPSVNGIKVTKKDIKVSNGIIHALSGVLVPQ